ncbi:MAG: hypothetical protein WKG07_37890 [Hymenobacter sp.]
MQGNILKGHGRQFTFNLFLSFKAGQTDHVRTWIANFSSVFVTTARKQLDETQLFHDERIPGGVFAAFFLSAEGYKYLGVGQMPGAAGSQFRAGMKASNAALRPRPLDLEPRPERRLRRRADSRAGAGGRCRYLPGRAPSRGLLSCHWRARPRWWPWSGG